MKSQNRPHFHVGGSNSGFLRSVLPVLVGVMLTVPVLFAADAPPFTMRDFKLTGELAPEYAAFTLNATVHVENAKAGSFEILSGAVALTEVNAHRDWRVGVNGNSFVLTFNRAGDFPVQLKFTAAAKQSDGWNSLSFRVAPAAMLPVELHGLAADTQFQFTGAARPERSGTNFLSYLPSDGAVRLAWKEARKEEEGKLFYAAEMLSQITLSPGLMRQVALLDFKVMQGELNKVGLRLHGEGEVTRVQGDQVLAWNVEKIANSSDRRLVIQLNQPQKDGFLVQVQLQTPLDAFPQTAEAVQLRPEGGTRFAGYLRIVNDGAVRLEVAQASGLSQISPEQFPETDATRNLFRAAGSQRFAYRFSSADFALRIQADQIFPELSVNEVIAYHLGDIEQAIDAEIELDVREAPLRELLLQVPKRYVIARLTAGDSLSDYFLRDPAEQTNAELRLVFGQPVSGRQVIQLRLERNQAFGSATNWVLPRIDVLRAKSVRGQIGVAADAGFRLTAERTQALTEMATAFFPAKLTGLQAAFRLSDSTDPAWEATIHVERLAQTVQADVFHLFSIGEGIAYGSSVINYVITGSPVSSFKVELSSEYANVEFTGKDVRAWPKTDGGYIVQLHTPVSGSYTLLATYERAFKPQGETLAFTGARPLDAQSEQGHTIIISTYQFKVDPQEVSPGLLALEPGEVPAEYRLFFDAPILKAYRYSTRPFNLRLALSPFAQGGSLSQVVDRAMLTNRISKEGQVLTDAHYFVKNRGNTHFKVILPPGTDMWSAMVNGMAVVPVRDTNASLIPLPQLADPNAVLTVDLKLASKSADSRRLNIAAPKVVDAPVMLEQWQMEPDAGQRLVYSSGSLAPEGGIADFSGFAGLARLFTGGDPDARHARNLAAAMVVLVGIAVVAWRWARREGGYRFSARHLAGTVIGLAAFAGAIYALGRLGDLAGHNPPPATPRNLSFLAPVQQAGSALNIEVLNVPETTSSGPSVGRAWPVVLALIFWAYGWLSTGGISKALASSIGWTLLAWTALRWPNGAPIFFLVVAVFLLVRVLLPCSVAVMSLPTRRRFAAHRSAAGAVAATVLLLGLASANTGCASASAPASAKIPAGEPALAESVNQQIRVEEKFAFVKAKIRWPATKGQMLPLVTEPAVLTRAVYPTRSTKLVQVPLGNLRAQQLQALEDGVFDIEIQYQVQVYKSGIESGISLPTQSGLINQAQVTLVNLDVDVLSPQAVSVQRNTEGTNTLANLVLSPQTDARIAWRPRSRDVRREKPVFYAEIHQLYVPAAGVIEGAHYAAIRPAQGELSELVFTVPSGATITDVTDPAGAGAPNRAISDRGSAPASVVSLWRFDPDTRKLRVNLSSPISRPFAIVIRSQVATGPLPVEQRVGLVAVENAASQIGLLGVATGNEVQLDSVNSDSLSTINLEDFPGITGQSLAAQIPGLTLRRAFRYPDLKATAVLKASAVEPDVRVDTQNTISLGEDRTVLAVKATVNITRAGIFRLSFALPAGMEVESLSGDALSHWTESKSNADRIITMNLRGKTEGQQQFAITLTGPGVKATNAWVTPQLVLREAGKQRGSLFVTPEQGMRLQLGQQDGLTQLDPQRLGIRQKGVLAFQILQTPWNLALDIEQVDPWIQVMSLQHTTITESQARVTANLQYQIENTGLKSFRILLPANAEGVRFLGEQVTDFLKSGDVTSDAMQAWDVKLSRRFIGAYMLQASYQVPLPTGAATAELRGVRAMDVNLQRGFVTVQSGGRLEVRVDSPPESLQPAEWQSIPRVLQQDLQAAPANFCYRLVDPAFRLPLRLERHEVASLLPARVQNVTFSSVISDDGVMLTHARLEIIPGDKALLNLALPKDAAFWFAFVNQNGVWPWREAGKILIPLEQRARGDKPEPVEFFYSCKVGTPARHSIDLELLAPKFDLPLENVTWQVYLDKKWQVTRWTGSLQLQQQQEVPRAVTLDTQSYLQSQVGAQREKTHEAEQMLAFGNDALQKGDPQQARRAFQSAYGLSQGDNAFNEDARVQLNNLKLQQALVGLNVRQAEVAGGDASTLGSRFRDLRSQKEVAYTQQDAKDIIERNTADENNAYMRLAQRLIQQQDAAISSPAVIRATIPEQGRLLTFRRSVVVETMADVGAPPLNIRLEAVAAKAASSSVRGAILVGTLALLAIFAWIARPNRGSRVGEA